MKTIVFLALQLSQPRCIKRIESVRQAGFPIKVYGFDNGLYNASLRNLPFKVDKIIERKKEDSKWKKILLFIRTIKEVKRDNPSDSILYFFSSELGTIAYLLGYRNYIYEEGDINASKVSSSVLRRILLSIERQVVKKSKLTVFTSEGFTDFVFGKDAPDNIVILPNKLSNFFREELKNNLRGKEPNFSNIKFGFIGLIRYPNTIIRFAKVIGKHFPHHEFHFFGDVRRSHFIDEELKSYKNIFFHGPFINPDDLEVIYSKVDINIVCYDTDYDNVRIAEPNKLYESIFFETPIVVSKDTYLERRVDTLGVGFSICASNDESIINFVNGIDRENWNNIIQSMKSIPVKDVIDNPSELISRMKDL